MPTHPEDPNQRRDRVYTVLYRRYSPRLTRFLVRCVGDASRAKELVNDTFVAIAQFEKLPNLRGCRAYVFRTAINQKNVAVRALKSEQELFPISTNDLEDSSLVANTHHGDEIDHAHLLAAIERAMAQLSPRQQAVVALRYEGWTCAEVGARLGMSEEAVKQQSLKARDKLTRILWPTKQGS